MRKLISNEISVVSGGVSKLAGTGLGALVGAAGGAAYAYTHAAAAFFGGPLLGYGVNAVAGATVGGLLGLGAAVATNYVFNSSVDTQTSVDA